MAQFRIALLLVAGFLMPPFAAADEPPPAPASAPPTLRPTALEIEGSVASLLPCRASDDLLLGLADGTVLRRRANGTVAWRAQLGDAATQLAAAPRDAHVLALASKELVVLDGASGAVRWRAPRPVAAAFDKEGAHVVAIDAESTIRHLAAADGTEARRVRPSDRRKVVAADLHPDGALVVLGVADG